MQQSQRRPIKTMVGSVPSEEAVASLAGNKSTDEVGCGELMWSLFFEDYPTKAYKPHEDDERSHASSVTNATSATEESLTFRNRADRERYMAWRKLRSIRLRQGSRDEDMRFGRDSNLYADYQRSAIAAQDSLLFDTDGSKDTFGTSIDEQSTRTGMTGFTGHTDQTGYYTGPSAKHTVVTADLGQDYCAASIPGASTKSSSQSTAWLARKYFADRKPSDSKMTADTSARQHENMGNDDTSHMTEAIEVYSINVSFSGKFEALNPGSTQLRIADGGQLGMEIQNEDAGEDVNGNVSESAAETSNVTVQSRSSHSKGSRSNSGGQSTRSSKLKNMRNKLLLKLPPTPKNKIGHGPIATRRHPPAADILTVGRGFSFDGVTGAPMSGMAIAKMAYNLGKANVNATPHPTHISVQQAVPNQVPVAEVTIVYPDNEELNAPICPPSSDSVRSTRSTRSIRSTSSRRSRRSHRSVTSALPSVKESPSAAKPVVIEVVHANNNEDQSIASHKTPPLQQQHAGIQSAFSHGSSIRSIRSKSASDKSISRNSSADNVSIVADMPIPAESAASGNGKNLRDDGDLITNLAETALGDETSVRTGREKSMGGKPSNDSTNDDVSLVDTSSARSRATTTSSKKSHRSRHSASSSAKSDVASRNSIKSRATQASRQSRASKGRPPLPLSSPSLQKAHAEAHPDSRDDLPKPDGIGTRSGGEKISNPVHFSVGTSSTASLSLVPSAVSRSKDVRGEVREDPSATTHADTSINLSAIIGDVDGESSFVPSLSTDRSFHSVPRSIGIGNVLSRLHNSDTMASTGLSRSRSGLSATTTETKSMKQSVAESVWQGTFHKVNKSQDDANDAELETGSPSTWTLLRQNKQNQA